MSRPFFSIILPTYNRASLLPRCIGSVIKQDFLDWELIVIDDGSTDNTKELVKSIIDKRIKYIYQENAERSAARNKGIAAAKGEWICFLDSDDEYLPNHLNAFKKEIEINSTARLLISGHYISKNGKQLKHPLISNNSKTQLVEITQKFILMNSVCVNYSILERNNFNIEFRLWEDTHLWLRIAAQYPVYQMDEYTVIQHIHEQGTVVQGMKKIRLKEVVQYVSAIQDLRDKQKVLFEGKLPPGYFNEYIDSKYRMYLYQARQNKQFVVAYQIWIKAWRHRRSWYLFTECPKIALNYLNIGLHAR